LQLGKTATTLARVGTNLAVDATVSAGSQYAKTGDVNGQRVVIDASTGFIGSRISNVFFSGVQSSQAASELYREADQLSKLTSVNKPILQSQLSQATTAVKKATSYGQNTAVGIGAASSNTFSGALELQTKLKKKDTDSSK